MHFLQPADTGHDFRSNHEDPHLQLGQVFKKRTLHTHVQLRKNFWIFISLSFRLGLIPACVRLGLLLSSFNPVILSPTPMRLHGSVRKSPGTRTFSILSEWYRRRHHITASTSQFQHFWATIHICYGLEHYFLSVVTTITNIEINTESRVSF